MVDAAPASGLHDVERPDDIGVDIRSRIFQAVTDPRLRGEVDDHLRRMEIAEGLQRGVVFQHLDGFRKARVCLEDGVPILFEPDVVVGGHPVQPDDLMALRQQQPAQVKADESGAAGDENAHVRSGVDGAPTRPYRRIPAGRQIPGRSCPRPRRARVRDVRIELFETFALGFRQCCQGHQDAQ
jgi:hypothetical protein